MSHTLINRNRDLADLKKEGFQLEILNRHLLVHKVPYVNKEREVKFGTLVSTLQFSGETTHPPDTHVAFFDGEEPCDQHGHPLNKLIIPHPIYEYASGKAAHYTFSQKPSNGYPDYHQKMRTYADLLTSYAQAIDPTVTARTFGASREEDPDHSVFHYPETASTRAGISHLTRKLVRNKIAIVGLGGTGSYVLDQMAKTPVWEIHLFDDDVFANHNAFRAPGAPSKEELEQNILKVAYFHGIYSRMHRGIIQHAIRITEANVSVLNDMDFVFICLDDGASRKLVVDALRAANVPFIDVGMGLTLVENQVFGALRVSTESQDRHLEGTNPHLPLAATGDEDLYAQNIQVSELNALNAMLAVVRWKKLCGFYLDLEDERQAVYSIDGNHITNERNRTP